MAVNINWKKSGGLADKAGHAVVCQNKNGVDSPQGHLWEAPFDTNVGNIFFQENNDKVRHVFVCHRLLVVIARPFSVLI